MGWVQRLYETYQNCTREVGRLYPPDGDGEPRMPLLPLFHTVRDAHLEITVDQDGGWVPCGARIVGKADAPTIVPGTERAASRTAAPRPFPLFDTLQYIAGDYPAFGGKKTSGYAPYIEAVEKWSLSPFGSPALRAVLKYLKKGCLIADLHAARLLPLTSGGTIMERQEDRGEAPPIFQVVADPADAFVRFRVRGLRKEDDALYRSEELRTLYIRYRMSMGSGSDLCMIRGEWMPSAVLGRAGGRSSGLVQMLSADDPDGFTYRGRFLSGEQAFSLGFETTSKANNAFKWLISSRNGKTERTILTWDTRGTAVPQVQERLELPDGRADAAAMPAVEVYNGLRNALARRYAALTPSDTVVVMALDRMNGAGGRLSITYYRELHGGELLDRMAGWNASCGWRLPDLGSRGRRAGIGAPSLKEIADAAYGANAGDDLTERTIRRLLPCVVDAQPLPEDIVACAVRRAAAPAACEPYQWRRTLAAACALVRKSKNDAVRSERYRYALDGSNRERAYLFGRLLACAEQREGQPAAARWMQNFAIRPRSTWRRLEERIRCGRDVDGIDALIAEIMPMFAPDDFESDDRLDETYLLGYSLQLADLQAR